MVRRFSTVVRKGRKAIQNFDLLKILQSEINYELTNKPFQHDESGSLGDFVLEWDSQTSQDVLLRKKCESGEEVAVSALLGSETSKGNRDIFPREVMMKVCIKKPGLNSILQFDCEAVCTGAGAGTSCYDIHNAYYIPSASALSSSAYGGPLFRTLNTELQDELRRYLEARGIGEHLVNFLLQHLHKKEQGQYVNWLHKLEAVVSQKD